MGGNSSWPLQISPSATYNISDTVSLERGRHSIRFGGEFRRGTVNYFRATDGAASPSLTASKLLLPARLLTSTSGFSSTVTLREISA